MRLDWQEVAGFFNFPSPLTLDLRALPDGLIAVIGQNGAGKTSLVLDAPIAALYGPGVQNKAFPSRDGVLATYATSPTAYIDTRWSLADDRHVRCRVNVDGVKRKVDAVLEERGADGVMRPVNNGLIATYRDAVNARFHSLRSLLASAYAAQNKRGGFGDLGQKERMELFVEYADLAHYETLSQTSKRCWQAADSIAVRMRSAIEALRVDDEALKALSDRLDAIEQELTIQRDAVTFMSDRCASLTRDREACAAEASRHDVAAARVDEIARAIARAEAAFAAHVATTSSIEAEYEASLRRIERRHVDGCAAVTRRREAEDRASAELRADREARVVAAKDVMANADNINDAVRRVQAADQSIAKCRSTQQECLDLAGLAQEHIHAQQAPLADCHRAKVGITAAKHRASLLESVKFGEQCAIAPACPLVTDAVQAKQLISELEYTASQEATISADVTHWTGVRDEARQQHSALASKIEAYTRTRAESTGLASQAPQLALAEQRIIDLTRESVLAEQGHADRLATIAGELVQVDAVRQADAESARAVRVTRLDEADIRKAELAAALSASEVAYDAEKAEVDRTSGAKLRLDRIETELAAAQAAQMKASNAAASLTSERTGLQARLDEQTSRRAHCDALSQRLACVEDEALAWAMLAKACGRDGLQRLEIDAAGPIVSDLANQLLRVGYGARFSVDVVTQVATADGSGMKERFTIQVLDNEHGGEPRDVGDLSGGERVIVEEAIRAALSCYVNMRSHTPCRTIWRDETTGALDADNAPRYVAMLRKMRELSGADQIIFITHSAGCAVLADAQVRVSNGRAITYLPPYGEAHA